MSERRVVFSTEHGRMCPYCMKPIAQCKCAKGKKIDADKPVGDGRVRVSRETKGRGGKMATVIVGVPLSSADLKELAKKLKAKCGTGGTAKDGVIVIQGDHRDALLAELKSLGYDAKASGG